MKRILALGLQAVLAGSLGASALAARPGDATTGSAPAALTGPQLGSPAPDFALRTLDGRSVSLASYRGKTLVINVWATWCPPCRQEMPDLIGSYPKLHGSDVEFLGVDTTEEAPIVRAYVVAKSVPYAQAIDTHKTFEKAYDIQYFPTTFVIDPNGILRARYIDVVGPTQLAQMTDAAKAGRNASIVSVLQEQIDTALVDPGLATNADAAATLAYAKAVNKAIDQAERMLDRSDPSKGKTVDLLRTRVEEEALRDRAITAFAVTASTSGDKELLERMRGDAAQDREQYQESLADYQSALALNSEDDDALTGLAFVANRLGKTDLQIDADRKLSVLEPDSVDALVDLGLAYGKAKQFDSAYATFTQAVALGKKHVDANLGSPDTVRKLAWVHLYFGRTYAKGGDPAHSRAQFQELLAWTQKLPKNDIRHDMYLEEGQEAIVALGLAHPSSVATVSLAPWTGPELPGSIPNTIKYRLVVAGNAGKHVDLAAKGVAKGWIASFCSDRVCSPFKVSVAIPQSGVKIIEFQLVPPDAGARTGKVRVVGTDGSHTSVATT
jgi:tetratricopeptide (TPR) repeat protein